MKKRCISLLLSLLLLSTFCFPMAIATEIQPTDDNVNNDTLLVSKSESGLYLEENSPSNEIVLHDENVYTFMKDTDNFYYTESNDFPQNFRVYLENDGSLTPVEKIELDTNSADPTAILISEYGYSSNDQLVNDIHDVLEQGFVGSITVYADYEDYTEYVNGKLVSTEFVEYAGMETDGGVTIASVGERGIESDDDLETVNLHLYCYDSRSLQQNRIAISAGTLISFFGRFAFNLIKNAMESAPTSEPYVMIFPSFNGIMRYTNVIENDMEYIGCVSNAVDIQGILSCYAQGTIITQAEYAIEGSFESDHFNNDAAEQAAVNNYLIGGLIDKIDDYSIVVEYPNDSSRTFTFLAL